jgi:hypothetical protein
MVDDERVQHLIHWSGPASFVVVSPDEFSKEVLPQHFKHNNFASFVRQLNMYGFHKVNDYNNGGQVGGAQGGSGGDGSGRTGGLAAALGEQMNWEFSHPMFRRGKRDLLSEIRRKLPGKGLGSRGGGGGGGGALGLGGVVGGPGGLDEMLFGKETKEGLSLVPLRILALEDKLKQTQDQLSAVWDEVTVLRQQMAHQQQTAMHLASFLAGAFGDDVERAGPKRKRFRMDELPQLVLTDVPETMAGPGGAGTSASGALLAAAAAVARDGTGADDLDAHDLGAAPPPARRHRGGDGSSKVV